MAYFGPTIPHDAPDHDKFTTPKYLVGYANKVRADLKKLARLYNGIKVRIFTLDESSTPCTNCIDSFTGQVLISDCPVCFGTGKLAKYTSIGDFDVVTQINPKIKSSSELGDSEVSQQNSFEIIDVPLLEDQDLLVTLDTKRVYKIIDMEPSVVAVGGEIIAQFVSCNAISKGSPEYQVITW